MKYLHKILNNCAEVSQLALQAGEHPLSFRKKLEVKLHLYYCRCCSNFVMQSRLMDQSFRHYFHRMEQVPPFAASDDFKAKMKEKLQ